MTLKNEMLLHSVKTIEYRFLKSIVGSKDNFGDFKISDNTRSPNEIVNHMFDLVLKTITILREGHFNCPAPEKLDFNGESKRFIAGLHELKKTFENNDTDAGMAKKLLQGPIMDMATHIGQIAMLNGLNGNKIPKESYYSADLG